ncbi:polysaccharide deacetylase family protein [Rhodococcus sp. MEB064]|uniref:polysaccharide deacetylase family protein n=1 Tax=Rhodococcus sp. MEB064 TaxID=1587522 RepID=UPI0005ABF320|nr:polysaccharide deacetylase family protein [Rhodococcus sp. MEB064]KIQ18232.1 polysaccharide deacetylase [Rhodococcus sp. MEB064]
MALPSHGRFPYSPITDRPHLEWPDGASLAVYVAVNCEHFPYDDGSPGIGYTPAMDQPNSYNWGWREYGNRVGGFALADTLRDNGIRPTLLVNSEIYDHAPDLVAAYRALGADVVAHGRTNAEQPNQQDPDAERRSIAHVRRTIEMNEGTPPRGWMSPGANPSRVTEDLLAEHGFEYTLDWPIDDQPVWMTTTSGPLLAVPYPHEVNDLPVFVHHHASAADFESIIVDSFDELKEQSRRGARVLAISTHTFLTGQPHRLRRFRRALEHMTANADGVWFTTAGDIAEHYRRVTPPSE